MNDTAGESRLLLVPVYCDGSWALMPLDDEDGQRIRYEEKTLRDLRQLIGDTPRYESEEAALAAMSLL